MTVEPQAQVSSQEEGPTVIATVIPESGHPIREQQLDREALKVLYRLRDAGFKGYLVGGGVRDLYLGRTPKDFDISTDARPGQLRQLFRNSRTIGRRFRRLLRGLLPERAKGPHTDPPGFREGVQRSGCDPFADIADRGV